MEAKKARQGDYIREYGEIPECAEKLIFKVILYLQGCTSIVGEIIFVDTIEKLKKSLENEELDSTRNLELVEQAKDLAQVTSNESIKSLEELLGNIRDIDIQRLIGLVEKNNLAIETIRDKNIYFFMGLTGHGKSTTIHYLAGSRFEKYTENGEVRLFAGARPYFKPDPPASAKNLQYVTTSPYPESDTHSIIPVVINLKSGGEAILCDSPGFEDTCVELDIANSLMIENAIQQCSGVKPIVVISKNMGERMKGLTDLSMMLSRMVQKLKENASRFTYVFTNYNEAEAETIYSSIKDLKNTDSFIRNTDEGFKILIDSIEQKTKPKKRGSQMITQVITIDLENNDESYREEVFEDIIDGHFIINPSNFFRLTLSIRSHDAIHCQMDKHAKSIKTSLIRGDLTLALYKLNELNQLTLILNRVERIESKYEDIRKMLLEHLNSSSFEMWTNEHTLISTDLERFCSTLKRIQETKVIRDILCDCVDTTFDDMKSKMIDYVNNIELNLNDKNNLADDIRKMANLKLIFEYFKKNNNDLFLDIVKEKYEGICSRLASKINELANSCKDLIESDKIDFGQIQKLLSELKFFYECFGQHLNSIYEISPHQDIISLFEKNIGKKIKDNIDILTKNQIDEDQLKILCSNENYISKMLEYIKLHDHLDDIESIKKEHGNLLEKVKEIFKNVLEEFEAKKIKVEKLKDLQSKFNKLSMLRRVEEFIQISEQYYQDIIKYIERLLDNLKRDMTEELRPISNEMDNINGRNFCNSWLLQIDTDKVLEALKMIKMLEWIEPFLKTLTIKSFLEDIELKVNKNIEALSQMLRNNEISIENYEKINESFELAKSIESYRKLTEIYTAQKKTIDCALESFESALIVELDHIITRFPSTDIEKTSTNYHKAELSLNFIEKCNNYSQSISKKLQNKLKKTDESLKKHINTRLDVVNSKLNLIQNINDENNIDEVSKLVDMVHEQMKSLSFIGEEMVKLDRLGFRNAYSRYKSNLSQYHINVQHELNNFRKMNAEGTALLAFLIQKINCISLLDEFIDDKDHKFKQLYYEYSREITEETIRIYNESLGLLNDHKFAELSEKILFFKTTKNNNIAEHYFTHVKNKLNLLLKKAAIYVKDISNGTIEFNYNKLTSTISYLKSIDDAQVFLSDYIENSVKEELSDFMSKVNKAMCEDLKRNLDRLDQCLEKLELTIFENKLDIILKNKNELQTLCGKEANGIEISERLEKLENDSRSSLVIDMVKKKFANKDIDELTRQAAIIYDKLRVNYSDAQATLRTIIIDKFNKEIEAAKKMEEIKNAHYEKCDQNIPYLLNDLQKEIRNLLDDYVNKRTNIVTKSNLDLEEYFSKEQYDEILYNFVNDPKYFNRTANFLLRKCVDLKKIILISLSENKHHQVIDHFKLISKMNEMFSSKITSIKSCREEILEQIDTYYISTQDSLAYMLTECISTINPDKLERFEHNYQILAILSKLDKDHFDKRMKEVNENLKKTVQKVNNLFLNSFEDHNFSATKNLMEIMRKLQAAPVTNQYINHDKLLTYNKMGEYIKNKIKSLLDRINQTFPTDSNIYESVFDKFFSDLNKSLESLRNLEENFEEKVQYQYSSLLANIGQKIQKSFNEAQQKFTKILENTDISLDKNDFKVCFYTMKSYEKQMKSFIHEDKPIEKYFMHIILNKLGEIKRMLFEEIKIENIDNATNYFVKIKTYSTKLPMFKVEVDKELDELMADYIKKIGYKSFGVLGLSLRQSAVGNSILQEHKCFEAYQRSVFNEKTSKQDIDYVLRELNGENLDIRELREYFDDFKKAYDQKVIENLTRKIDLAPLVQNVRVLSDNIFISTEDINRINWNSSLRKKIPKLLANLFALYTIMNSSDFFDNNDANTKSYLFRPHPAQIIAIFLMLGIGYKLPSNKSDRLNSNLIEVGTGEGKSVTLGVVSALLAQVGFEVYCVCYSQYLSDRDYKNFNRLFDKLNVSEFIHYGTIKKICEDYVNRNGNIREIINNFLLKNGGFDSLSTNRSDRASKRLKILLIDEVDVFFKNDFYGMPYKPVVSFSTPDIKALIRHMRSEKNSLLSHKYFDNIMKSTQYEACAKKFPKWIMDIITKHLIKIYDELESSEIKNTYIVRDDMIGYVQQDNVTFTASYGYETMLAYFYENERKNISDQSLENKINLILDIGNYSFAEIPKDFMTIMGLSGTLQSLSEPESKIVDDEYNIKLKTFIPSVYDKKKLKFNEINDIKIEKEETYHKMIAQEIRHRQIDHSETIKRPVLVFFESKKALDEFHQSKEFDDLRTASELPLTEEASNTEKNDIIGRATTAGKCTLCTRIFGRGTDFIVNDNTVIANGGVHVLQTFLSEELSEEIQIKGRAARQGDPGSYSMVLLESSLQKFDISSASLQQHSSDLYKYLNEMRNSYFKKNYSKCIENANTLKRIHADSMEFLEAVYKKNAELVKNFLLKYNID